MSGIRVVESLMRKAIFTYKLIPDEAKITVALSGGKDSLTLLHLLHQVSGRGIAPFKLHAVHIGGEFSCGAGVSRQFLQKCCDDLHVPLTVIESSQKLETLECYSCSRERRRLLFDAAKANDSTIVAFGHHRDDHIQTLLMNLLHKGEFAGNLAKVPMVHYGVTIIRPLLFVSEDQIISYAKDKGFLRAMCRCPVGQKSMRKKADDMLKQIEEIFPNARVNLARAGWLRGSEGALTP
ncbi:MAG: tRNA 2-thiocytidine biosynthesis TtcA family protein [Parachlamydiales bacterium]|jgi:tRNA(Ile)-lysidine synthase TilS/MesJ